MFIHLRLIKPVTALTNEVVKELAFGGCHTTGKPWFGSGLTTEVPGLF